MENFTRLSIDLALSSRLKEYDKLVNEGESKMRNCVFYIDGACKKFHKNSKILTAWKKDGAIVPHSLFCYLCPFYAFRDDGERITFTMYDLYVFYVELKARIEKDVIRLEERLDDMTFSSSVFIRRRYNDMINLLNDVQEKIDIIKTVLNVTKEI